MGSRKLANPKPNNKKPNSKTLNPKSNKFKKKPDPPSPTTIQTKGPNHNDQDTQYGDASSNHQLTFFLNEYQSANSLNLSSLELDSIKDSTFVGPNEFPAQVGDLGGGVESLGKMVKGVFLNSWRDELCKGGVVDGAIEPGSPAVLMITTSALRAIELLRGVRSMTKECHGVKLFSKHMKVEEQAIAVLNVLFARQSDPQEILVASLKNRVNFASGTPSRVKKLIDMEVLGLTRLKLIVLDIHPDVKGYSLLTLPQVRDEFWDLYKNYFHQRLLQGDLFTHLFGPIPKGGERRGKR